MTFYPPCVLHIVDLNGGELVGRTRLQKSLYFLESRGLGFGFDFEYHHYGPFSDDLAIATEDAIALNLISQEKRMGNRIHPYSIFRSITKSNLICENEDEPRKKLLAILSSYDAISLELAATADFLENAGFAERAWEETKLRKASKATPERISNARKLLQELNGVS